MTLQSWLQALGLEMPSVLFWEQSPALLRPKVPHDSHCLQPGVDPGFDGPWSLCTLGTPLRKQCKVTHTKCPRAPRRDPGNEKPVPQVPAGWGSPCSCLSVGSGWWGSWWGEQSSWGHPRVPAKGGATFVSSNSCCDHLLVTSPDFKPHATE